VRALNFYIAEFHRGIFCVLQNNIFHGKNRELYFIVFGGIGPEPLLRDGRRERAENATGVKTTRGKKENNI
jgi:hypothetical protein